MPGPIGQRLLIRAATVQPLSRATNAAAVDAAGIRRLNMSHTRNTKPAIYKYHEQWAVKNGYRNNQQASKDSSTADQRARSTDKQAKPSSNRQASMDPGTSFKHP